MRRFVIGCALTLLCAAPAPAKPPALPVVPSRVERPEFVAAMLPPNPGPSRPSVELTARANFHINPDYPLHFASDTGERVERAAFDFFPCANSKESCRAQAQVPFSSGTLAFSLCDPERCLIEKIALRIRQ